MNGSNQGPWGGGGQGAPGGGGQPFGGTNAPGGGQGGGYGGPPGGGYGGPSGPGGGYGGPPGGGYGGPPGGGYGGPPGGGYGGPPGPGGGYGGQPPFVPQVPGQAFPSGTPTDPLAIASLAMGLISAPSSFCCSFFSIPLALAAAVTGLMAIGKARQRGDDGNSKVFAMIGIVASGVSLLLLVVFLALGVAGAILGKR